MDIDWSKAPEGAEFYSPSVELFYRHLDGEFQKFSESRGRWTVAAGERYEYTNLIAKPAEWNGEPLPPVGAACEYRVGNGTWYPCTIRYVTTPISDEEVQVVIHCPHLNGDQIGGVGSGIGEINFRPARTPEQIAAEAYQRNLGELADHIGGYFGFDDPRPSDVGVAEYLLDHGYRKFEIVEGE